MHMLGGAPPRGARSERTKPGFARGLPRYALVGASGVVVNLVILWMLHTVFGWHFTLASALATQTAIGTNYLGNELWTFHRRELAWSRAARFEVASSTGLVMTVLGATLALEILPPMFAQLAGIAVGAAANYAINFFWTWRR